MRRDQRRFANKYTVPFGIFLLGSFVVFNFASDNYNRFSIKKELGISNPKGLAFLSSGALLQSAQAAAAAATTSSNPPALGAGAELPHAFYKIFSWATWGLKWGTFGVSNFALAITSPLSFLFKAFWLGLGAISRIVIPFLPTQEEPLKYTPTSRK